MARALAVGDEAPNFDLTSTEDVVLMLRDEVARTAVVLYFFADVEGDRVRDDLLAFARSWEDLVTADTRVLGVSPAKLPALKELQKELHLPFPLLTDDRGFSASYGLEPAQDDAGARAGARRGRSAAGAAGTRSSSRLRGGRARRPDEGDQGAAVAFCRSPAQGGQPAG